MHGISRKTLILNSLTTASLVGPVRWGSHHFRFWRVTLTRMECKSGLIFFLLFFLNPMPSVGSVFFAYLIVRWWLEKEKIIYAVSDASICIVA